MKTKTILMILVVVLLCLCCLPVGAFVLSRPWPVEQREELYEGVVYYRKIHSQPRAMVAHIVTVQLDAPGVRMLVTPRDEKDGMPYQAMTTSAFAAKYGLQIAVNGGGFEPWYSNGPWDYYPHSNDPVKPRGFTMSDGREIEGDRIGPTIYFDRGIASFREMNNFTNAISGDYMLVTRGEALEGLNDEIAAPRTAIGIDHIGKKLIIIVVDGRQPFYSEGATIKELADLLILYGAEEAMSLDGGGSSTMVLRNELGLPYVVNSPIHAAIPGWERPVATHIGVFVEGQ